jgi:LuxR family maltose regulon positive regulatory protein
MMGDSIRTDAVVEIAVGPTGDPPMLAKLDMPTLPSTTLRRPRLLDQVTAGVGGRLTVVCAPAGAGKTTLMADWASSGLPPGPVAWISLDACDRQPGVFWFYLLAGLRRAEVVMPGVPVPDHPYRLQPSFVRHLSAALYRRSEPVVVVLDDADALAGSPLCGQLDFLLRNAGPALRLVLLTRADPPVPLPRYRMAGTVTEIRAAELAATAAEAAALFERQGVALPADALDLLLRHTGGWMAGLVLSGLALRDPRRPSRPGGGPPPGAEDLDEYLDEEVLGRYPAPMRRFMIRTGVADHLATGLAEKLAGQQGAARMLGELARHNGFVTWCDEHADCYRYHPLLQHVLRARLDMESPGAAAHLHRQAAAWFLSSGEPAEAAVHAAAGGEWLTAARILVERLQFPHLLTGPGSGRLTSLLADLPTDVPGPEAALVRAAIAVSRGDTVACAAELAAARAAGTAPAEQAAALGLTCCAVAAGLAAATGDAEAAAAAAATAETLIDQQPASDRLAATHLLVLTQSARTLLGAGRIEAALAILEEARRVAATGGDDVRATCDGLAALAEAMRGRLGRAARMAGAETDPPRDQQPAPVRSPAAQVALACVAAETGDVALARRRLAALTEAGPPDPVVAAVTAVVRARVCRADGDPTAALAVLDAARRPSAGPMPSPWLDGRLAAEAAATWTGSGRPDLATQSLADLGPAAGAQVALELARARLAAGEADAAAAMATDLLHHMDLPLGVRVDALLLRAASALECGDTATARSATDRALRAAAPDRLRRPFLEAPPRLRGFLRHHGDLAQRHRWLDDAEPPRQLSPAPPVPIDRFELGTVLIEPLTEKEHEVLVHLAELLSTEEIARQMYVSVNTIRTHVRAILRKLAASRRNEAIRRARDLQII